MASRYAYPGSTVSFPISFAASSNSISKMPVIVALKDIVIVCPAGASFAMS